jgi:uncharacterized protein YrrD
MKTNLFAKELRGLKVYSDETLLGHVDEFYFDDQQWTIRYLVLDVGHWLKNRKVLISPVAIDGIGWEEGSIRIKATKEQIEHSPEASTDLPVARALEVQIHRHYGWGFSWPESFMGSKDDSAKSEGKTYDPHLRSTRILTGTRLVTGAGDVFGTVVDFVIDPDSWRIGFVAADAEGVRKVLLDPKSVQEIDVARREIRIGEPKG